MSSIVLRNEDGLEHTEICFNPENVVTEVLVYSEATTAWISIPFTEDTEDLWWVCQNRVNDHQELNTSARELGPEFANAN